MQPLSVNSEGKHFDEKPGKKTAHAEVKLHGDVDSEQEGKKACFKMTSVTDQWLLERGLHGQDREERPRFLLVSTADLLHCKQHITHHSFTG